MPLPKQSNGAFVVTGAGRGLGATIAEESAKLGYPVALIARTKSDLEKVQSEVENHDIKCSIHVCDLSSEESVASAFKEISVQHGSVRALVNNAATWTGGVSVEDLSTSDLKRSLDLNFFSAFYPIKETLKIWRSGREEDLCTTACNRIMIDFSRKRAFLRVGSTRFTAHGMCFSLIRPSCHIPLVTSLPSQSQH